MASSPDPLFVEYEGWFGVLENPGNRMFSFKRQSLASIRAAVGFIEIKSKTKSSEVVRLSTAHVAGKPFIRSVVVCLRYRPRGWGDWQEMGLRADSHQKAQELREFLVKTAWLPRAAAPPAYPAAAAAAAPTAAAVVVPAAVSPSDQSPPATPGLIAGHGSDSDDEVQWLDDVNGGLKMRLRVCKDRPSCMEVIAPPSLSATIVNHRPKRKERETAPPPAAVPELQIHRERSSSRDAARVLQFDATASPRMQQPPTAFAFPVLQQSQSRQQQQQQQPPSPLAQQLGAVPSAMENSAIDASSFLQTPAPSPMLQPLDMLQQPVLPQSQFQALLPQQQQQPAFCTGSMGALGNASMGTYGGANFGNYCIGGVYGSQPQQPPHQPALGTGDDPEYAKFAAEFRTLALRVDLLPPEKRRMAIAVAESITHMMCGM